jgi:arylsulfatase A
MEIHFKTYQLKIPAIALLILPAAQVFGVQPVQKPNFILILTDDQGWTCTSQTMNSNIPDSRSDYYETPNMQRLASKGIRFSSGYAPCALCCPTRRSIQFGQTPARQGDLFFKENYHPDYKSVPAIPQILKSISPEYRAAHYGKWDLRADIFPEDLGYDESDGNTGNRNGNMNSTKLSKFSDLFLHSDPKRIETITDRAVNFMSRQTKNGHPFYLQVSHYATHVDIQAKEETYQKFLEKKKGSIHDNPGWAAMLNDLDAGIGRILDQIEKLGIADHTYLILMADNGGVEFIPPVSNKFDPPSAFKKHTNNYPLRGGKWTLYEGGIRVPFMVIGPGIKPGSQCDIPVTGWDILPTLADLAGNSSTLPANLDGSSFRSLLVYGNEGKIIRKNDELVFHYFGRPHSAIRIGDYKLIKFWNLNKTELYNLKNDFGEINDLSKTEPGIAKELEAKLMAYLKNVNAEILQPQTQKKKKADNNED